MDQSPAIYRLAEAIKKFFPNYNIYQAQLDYITATVDDDHLTKSSVND
jgi:hypothetical protein